MYESKFFRNSHEKKKALLLIIFVLVCSFSGILSDENNAWVTFTINDGLADNQVHAAHQTEDGSIWFGTQHGLSCLSGGEWKTYRREDGLLSDTITALTSNNGVLYIGTPQGLCSFRDGQWNSITSSDGLKGEEVNCLMVSFDGTLWIGTDQAINCLKGNQFEYYTISSGAYINTIYQSSDSVVWVSINSGGFGISLYGSVNCYKNGNWENFAVPESRLVTSFAEGADGSMWFTVVLGPVYQYKNSNWTSYSVSASQGSLTFDGYISRIPGKIISASDGSIWVGAIGGVSHFQNNQWVSYNTRDGLADIFVYDIIESADGGIWIATRSGGVNRLEKEIWQTYTFLTDEEEPHAYASGVIEAYDGSIWVSTLKGAVSIKNNAMENYDWFDEGLVDDYLNGIYQSFDSTIWFATEYYGVGTYKNGIWDYYDEWSGLVNDGVLSMTQTSDSAMWFGTYAGVSRFKNNTWISYSEEQGLLDNEVITIEGFRDGTIWFGGEQGISILNQNGSWDTVTMEHGLSSNHIKTIVEASDGSVWAGTENSGVSVFQNGNWQSFTTSDGLVNNQINTIIEARDSAIWIGAQEGGVSRYKNGQWSNFSSEDGLSNNNICGICEARDGGIWFATKQGGVCRFQPDYVPPFTRLLSIPDSLIGIASPFFIYQGYDFRTPLENLLYSYAVKEINQTVTEADYSEYTSFTSVQTPALNNGTYKFYLRSIDTWGNIDPTPATYSFTVDITAPALLIRSPKQEQHIRENFEIEGSVFDNSPLEDFAYYQLSYSLDGTGSANPEWKTDIFTLSDSTVEKRDTVLGSMNTMSVSDGDYQIRLWAIDSLEHESEDLVYVTIDNTYPQAQITSPENGSSTTQTIEIKGTISDINLSAYRLEYKINPGEQWLELVDTAINQSVEDQLLYTWNNSSDSGEVSLKLTEQDQSGNITCDSVTFLLDNPDANLPTANIIEPATNAYLNGIVYIKGNATDELFDYYELQLKNNSIDTILIRDNSKKENSNLVALNTEIFSDNEYSLLLTVYNSKNKIKQDSISIIIDNSPPTAQITAPTADTISCFTRIQGTAADLNLKSMVLKYAPANETDLSRYILIDTAFGYWNTMSLNGNYKLLLSVEDLGGLTQEIEKFFVINNPSFEKDEGLKTGSGAISLHIPPYAYGTGVVCIEEKDQELYTFDHTVAKPLGMIYELLSSREESGFSKPGYLTFDYQSLNPDEYDEEKLAVFEYSQGSWNLLGGKIDPAQKTITSTISGLGVYGLMEKQTETAATAQGLDFNCQPRMFSPTKNLFDNKVTISFNLSQPENITIKVFSKNGKLVRNIIESQHCGSGSNVFYWDGRNYDHSFVKTGLYIVAAEVQGTVHSKIIRVMNRNR